MELEEVPRLLIEMTMAIVEKKRHGFPKAFEIAQATLEDNGFLRATSIGVKLTAKGQSRDREFQRRPLRRVLAFRRLWEKYPGGVG